MVYLKVTKKVEINGNNMCGYIYATNNHINGKWYIGQHLGKWRDTYYFGSGTLIKKSLKKYGKENFSLAILCWCNSLEELNEKEEFWINEFKKKGFELYNINSGGQGLKSWISLQTRRKISKSCKNHIPWNKGKHNYLSKESLEKMRNASLGNGWRIKGHKVSLDSRKKISNSLKKFFKENPLSKETRNKMSANRKNKVKIELTCGEKEICFESITKAAKFLKVKKPAIYRVLNGERTHIHGYKVKRIEE